MVDLWPEQSCEEKFSVEKERAGRFGGNLPASDCALGERCSRHLAEARVKCYAVITTFVPHLSKFLRVGFNPIVFSLGAHESGMM